MAAIISALSGANVIFFQGGLSAELTMHVLKEQFWMTILPE